MRAEGRKEEKKEGDGEVSADVRVPPVSEEERSGTGRGACWVALLGRGKEKEKGREEGVRVGCWAASGQNSLGLLFFFFLQNKFKIKFYFKFSELKQLKIIPIQL